LANLPRHVLLIVLAAEFRHELVRLRLRVCQAPVLFPSDEKAVVLVPARRRKGRGRGVS
jgi:hypothetical protein